MAKAKSTAKVSKFKKRWYPLIAPKMFNEQVIGETLIDDPSKAVGRVIPSNLMNLTGDMKKQNININFAVNSVTGDKAYTEVIGYRMLPSSVKRLVRRGKNKVDVSFPVVTADGNKVRIKIVLITISMTYLSVLGSLRHTTEDFVKKAAANLKFEDLIIDVITNKLQAEIRKSVNKIYPVKICEVRYLNIEGKGEAVEAPAEAIPAVEEKKEEIAEASVNSEETPKEEKPKKQRKKKEEAAEEALSEEEQSE